MVATNTLIGTYTNHLQSDLTWFNAALNWHIPPCLPVHARTHGPSHLLSWLNAARPLPPLQTFAAFAFHPHCLLVQHGDCVTPQATADVTPLSRSISADVFVLPGHAHLWCYQTLGGSNLNLMGNHARTSTFFSSQTLCSNNPFFIYLRNFRTNWEAILRYMSC